MRRRSPGCLGLTMFAVCAVLLFLFPRIYFEYLPAITEWAGTRYIEWWASTTTRVFVTCTGGSSGTYTVEVGDLLQVLSAGDIGDQRWQVVQDGSPLLEPTGSAGRYKAVAPGTAMYRAVLRAEGEAEPEPDDRQRWCEATVTVKGE